MSVVTGFVLFHGHLENSFEQKDGSDVWPIIEELNDWIKAQDNFPMADLTPHFGGGKHPQIMAWGAGLNHFDHEEFIEFALTRNWLDPECFILVLQHEQDEAPRTIRLPSPSPPEAPKP